MTGLIEQEPVGISPGPEQFALQAVGLGAGYGRRPYLKDIALGVRPGEVVAVLGANGAGKSTLIMALAGYLKAQQGSVLIQGRPAPRSMERRLRRGGISLITQERSVFMTLTVRQNIALGGGSVDDALALFPELREHLARPVGLLSGGQQQMLAVARAISSRPRVILADELSLGLGPKIVDRLLDVLVTTARDQHAAVVIVEQHIFKALRAADRAYVLRRGEVCLEADCAVLLADPDKVSDLYL